MSKEIVKTVVHLKDDKGWEQVLEFEGDKEYGHLHSIKLVNAQWDELDGKVEKHLWFEMS